MARLNNLTYQSRTTEVDAVSDRVIAEFEKGDWSSDIYLTGIFTRLKPASLRLTTAVNRMKAESNLEAKDGIRDGKVRAIYYLIMGYLHHPDAVIRAAAEKVDAVFEHYGVNIVLENYATESSLIESLLLDFAGEEMQTTIASLPGLSQLITELRVAQTAFEEALVIFEEEKADDKTKENATAIKKEVLSIINDKLIIHLRAMFQIDETKYGAFAGAVAQIIDDVNLIVKKRRKNPEQGGTVNEGTAGEGTASK
jgi:hypothetical protein